MLRSDCSCLLVGLHGLTLLSIRDELSRISVEDHQTRQLGGRESLFYFVAAMEEVVGEVEART